MMLIERGQIEAYRSQGVSINKITKLIGRSTSTFSEKMKRD
jgi:IS30 family transposase